MEHVLTGIPLIALREQQVGLVDEHDIGFTSRPVRDTPITCLFAELIDKLGWLKCYSIVAFLQSQLDCNLIIDMHLLLMVDQNIGPPTPTLASCLCQNIFQDIFILLIKIPINIHLRDDPVKQMAKQYRFTSTSSPL